MNRTLAPALLFLFTAVVPLLHSQPLRWDPYGPFDRSVDVLQRDSSGALIASGRLLGRTYRSTDAARSWSPLLPYALERLVVGPRGEYVAIESGGHSVVRSMDGGFTWYPMEARTDTTGGAWMHDVAVSPDGTVYALQSWFNVPDFLLYSTDDGASWTTLRRSRVGFRGFNRRGHLYGVVADSLRGYGSESLLRRSTDHGVTWTLVASVDSFPSSVLIAPDAALFVSARSELFRSTDDGETWQRRGRMPVYAASSLEAEPGGALVLTGSTSRGAGAFRTTDAGQTWDSLELSGVQPTRAVPVAGALVGIAGSLFRSTDGGTTAEPSFRGLPGSAMASIAAYGSRIVARPSRGSSLELRGRSWDTTQLGTAWVVSDDGTVWAAVNGRIRWSEDNGSTWTSSDSTFPPSPAYFGPGGVIAVIGNGNIWRSRDTARTWEVLDTGFRPPVMSIGFDTAGTVLVAARETGMWRYDESAGRFRTVPGGMAQASAIPSFVTKPTGEIFVATIGRGIRRSTDDGRTFAKVGEDAVGDDVLRVRYNDLGHLVAATVAGVFISRNNGDSWESHGPGEPVVVRDLALDSAGRVWIASDDGVFASVESTLRVDETGDRHPLALRVLPNPASGNARLVVPGGAAFTGVLTIADALGREVFRSLVTTNGTEEGILLPSLQFPNGLWRVRLTIGSTTFTAPFVVAR